MQHEIGVLGAEARRVEPSREIRAESDQSFAVSPGELTTTK
jgi:hypothetical protein